MYSTLIFITAFLLLLAVFIRRLRLTQKDLFLQKKMNKEEEKKVRAEKQIEPETKFKEKLRPELNKDENKIAEISNLFKKADTVMSQGNLEEAKKLFIQITALDEKHLDANNKLGLIYLKEGENQKAELIYKKITGLKQDAVYYSNLGLALFNQKKLEESALAYEKSISLDRRRPARFISLAHVYNELQKPGKALENFEEAAKLEPRNTELLFIIAELYKNKDELRRVKAILEKILSLEPYNEEAKKELEKLGLPQGQ